MSRETIVNGKAVLGIEFGSTRIKSVLIGPDFQVIASGSHEWENDYVNGIWTYSRDAILSGLQASYADLKKDAASRYGVVPVHLAAIGCPVCGDFLYGTELPEEFPRRFALHSAWLKMLHPRTGKPIELSSEPPWPGG